GLVYTYLPAETLLLKPSAPFRRFSDRHIFAAPSASTSLAPTTAGIRPSVCAPGQLLKMDSGQAAFPRQKPINHHRRRSTDWFENNLKFATPPRPNSRRQYIHLLCGRNN